MEIMKYSWVPNERGGPISGEGGGSWNWNVRSNQISGGVEISGGGGGGVGVSGNFDRIKKKRLFVNEIQFYH